MDQTTVRVAKDALGANQTIAEANRADFDAAGVTVLNLMSAPGAGKTALEEYERYKEGEAQRVLEEAMEQVPAGVSADRSLVEGPPAETLAEAAQDLDLLFLGSRGYGPIKGALLGSVSAKLMTSSPCSVLVFPRGSGVDPLGD